MHASWFVLFCYEVVTKLTCSGSEVALSDANQPQGSIASSSIQWNLLKMHPCASNFAWNQTNGTLRAKKTDCYFKWYFAATEIYMFIFDMQGLKFDQPIVKKYFKTCESLLVMLSPTALSELWPVATQGRWRRAQKRARWNHRKPNMYNIF